MAIGCGYGVPTPLNPFSQFVFNIGCLTVKIFFAIYINEVIEVFSIYYEKSEELSSSMALLNVVNQEEELSSNFWWKARTYFKKYQENSVKAWLHEQHF